MTKVNVSELEGAALDWAVAQIDDRDVYDLDWRWVDGEMLGFGTIANSQEFVCFRIGEPVVFGTIPMYSPSTDWSQGGPLIEKYRAWMDTDIQHGDPEDAEWSGMCEALEGRQMFGTTPLIAAMRAIVAAEIGETVDVPKELLK